MTKQVRIATTLIAFALGCASKVADAGLILHVDDDQASPQTADGTTWLKAYKDLQPAILRATSQPAGTYDEIRVAKGLYLPSTQPSEQDVSFHLVRGVRIRGGYPGYNTPSPDTQDITANVTILSGDINGDDGVNFANYDDNSYAVVIAGPISGQPVDNAASLEGFTITGGNGGGGNPLGASGFGAGIFSPSSNSPVIRDCRIVGNKVLVDGLTNQGGGMFVASGAAPRLLGCVFEANRAAQGGGVYLYNPSASVGIEHCTFVENIAIDSGGGMYAETNGTGGTVRILNCSFSRNAAAKEDGGGILVLASTSDAFEIVNALFAYNGAVMDGGGIYAGTGNVKPINCTVYGNVAVLGRGGGAFVNAEATPTITNCIFRANKAPSVLDDFLKQIDPDTTSFTLRYSHVEGCGSSTCGGSSSNNNSGDDPLFVDADQSNYHLQTLSTCANQGNDSDVPTGVTTDLDGLTRKVGTVDRGAFTAAFRSLNLTNQSESHVVIVELRGLMMTSTWASPRNRVVEGASLLDLLFATIRPLGILWWRNTIVVALIPIGAPFPDVAHHVVESPGIRLQRGNRSRVLKRIPR